jgi:hypothetical protein
MSKIEVGVNENVVLGMPEVLEKDGKFSVAFPFGIFGETSDAEFDPFEEELDEAGYAKTGASNVVIRVFPPFAPKATTFGGDPKSPEVMGQEGLASVKELQNTFTQFLLQYMTSDKIKFDPYRGMNVTRENYKVELCKEEVLNLVLKNLGMDFIALMQTVKESLPTTALRLLLVRQSAEKHFATFRNKFIRENPIVELMQIPAEASKLKFTSYEIGKGLNSGVPVAKPAEGAADDDTTVEAKDVFG